MAEPTSSTSYQPPHQRHLTPQDVVAMFQGVTTEDIGEFVHALTYSEPFVETRVQTSFEDEDEDEPSFVFGANNQSGFSYRFLQDVMSSSLARGPSHVANTGRQGHSANPTFDGAMSHPATFAGPRSLSSSGFTSPPYMAPPAVGPLHSQAAHHPFATGSQAPLLNVNEPPSSEMWIPQPPSQPPNPTLFTNAHAPHVPPIQSSHPRPSHPDQSAPPFRPSTPPLSAPILGMPSGLLTLAHEVVRARPGQTSFSTGSPESHTIELTPPPDWTPSWVSSPYTNQLSKELVEQHQWLLGRLVSKAILIGVACTFNDVEAGSEFLIAHPPDILRPHVDAVYNQEWAQLHQTGLVTANPYASTAANVGLLIGNDKSIRGNVKSEKAGLGSFLDDAFAYAFEVSLGSKDDNFFRLKSGNPSEPSVVNKINDICTGMAYAHDTVIVPYKSRPAPITHDDFYETSEFKNTVSVSTIMLVLRRLHQVRAYLRLTYKRDRPREEDDPPFDPTPIEIDILAHPPRYRLTQEWCYRVPLGDNGKYEGFPMNWQSPILLDLLQDCVRRVHVKSKVDKKLSVVEVFIQEQRRVSDIYSSQNLVWRLLLIPIALAATALYVAREQVRMYLAGASAKEALAATPSAVVVFQAKILSAEKVLKKWIYEKKSPEYALLHRRLIDIIEEVVRMRAPLIGGDVAASAFLATDVDHLAYSLSYVARLSKKKTEEPLLTKNPSFIETSFVASARTTRYAIELFDETSYVGDSSS